MLDEIVDFQQGYPEVEVGKMVEVSIQDVWTVGDKQKVSLVVQYM